MKKTVKSILIVFIAILCLFSFFTSKTYAKKSISDIFSEGKEFIQKGQSASNTSTISENSIKDMSGLIYNILLIIGVVMAVIIGMLIGIKFMTGSIEERAQVKESLIAYIAGCIVVFGAFAIWKILVIVLQST